MTRLQRRGPSLKIYSIIHHLLLDDGDFAYVPQAQSSHALSDLNHPGYFNRLAVALTVSY